MGLKLNTASSGSVTLEPTNTASNYTLTVPAQTGTIATTVDAGNYYAFKNRIINGNMAIDQRNAGASVTPTDGQYITDRWRLAVSQTSKFTAQQNQGSVTPPSGYINYLGFTSSSAYSIGSSDYFLATQTIEGLNIADFGWGTSNAQTVTLSFWVRSSLTGTFGGQLENSAGNRSYPFSYTISSANTWEQKSITITGDTSGTWLTTNGAGIVLRFSLGTGSGYTGTANAWSSNRYFAPTGATSVVGTNGATFYITGVQLEKGTVATSFDYRPYGTELALCQRYYTYFGNSNSFESPAGLNGTGRIRGQLFFPVTMRANPSFTLVGTPTFYGYVSGGTFSSVQTTNASTQTAMWDFNVTGGSNGGTWMGLLLTTGTQMQYSAEL